MKAKQYAEENKEHRKKYIKQWYEENKGELLAKQKEYAKQNPHIRKKAQLKWLANNKAKYNEWRAKNARTRRAADPIFALRDICRKRVLNALKLKGIKKNSKTESMIGCSWETLKSHIEAQFAEGMTWENRGEWEIDHIIPLSSESTYDGIIKLSHYTNLQPLWKEDNRKKSDKMPEKYC